MSKEPLTPPIVSVDVVLLTLRDSQLHVALHKRVAEPFADRWALPGGYVHTDKDEDALDAAIRILKDKVGLTSPYLEQLKTFAGVNRDPRGWSVSIAYYAVVPSSLALAAEQTSLKWTSIEEVRALPFDHNRILEEAVERIRSKTVYSSLPLHLMPPTFTLTNLQEMYETLLGGSLDKRTFRRWVESLGVLEEAPAEARGAHRPAQLYRFVPESPNGLALSSKALEIR